MTRLNQSPLAHVRRLRGREGLIWLDSAEAGPGAVSLLACEPSETLQGNILTDADLLRAKLAEHSAPGASGGLMGWIGFDGEFVLGVYPRCAVYDHETCLWQDPGGLTSQDEGEKEAVSAPILDFLPALGREKFMAMVELAHEFIAAGDIYQVNLSYPWAAPWPTDADALAFYEKLRSVSPAPFSAYANLGGTTLFSASPECFLDMRGREIVTRPIKGTRPRFPTHAARDAEASAELLGSEKERAELLMITDLERNDLGQVCEFGSVSVPQLWAVESFAQVHHLVSTVKGTLRPEVDHVSALAACFPGGSISGAPKGRALEIIAQLEETPRGIYTGAIGYFGFDGRSQFNIAIRTAVKQGNTIRFQVGAGIVADSIPEREWEETLHKASGLLRAAQV